MASQGRVLEMMREGVRVEERAVLLNLQNAMRALDELQISAEADNYVRERLDRLRRDTIEHEESFKRANAVIQEAKESDY